MTLIHQPSVEAERIEVDTPTIEIGQWYWLDVEERVKDGNGALIARDVEEGEEADFDGPSDDGHEGEDDGDEIERAVREVDEFRRTGDVKPKRGKKYVTKTIKYLCCVTELGSNYARVERVVDKTSWRIHFDEFWQECTPEPNHRAIIDGKVKFHQERVLALVDEVRQLTAGLGIVPASALPEAQTQGQALATASGTADIKAHKNALVKAKEDTLPEIFKKIEREHEALAVWMKADLMPALAELALLRGTTDAIEDRIFTVELYAGLVEELAQIKKGKAPKIDSKIYVMQRRHYMDEECLANYDAGGMEFEELEDFDKWLLRPENRNRILPHDRCVVAFRVRRNHKRRRAETYEDFIKIGQLQKADETTFLYIRNGEQVFRLNTEIDFDEELFPDADNELLLSGEKLWIYRCDQPVSDRRYQEKLEEYAARKKRHDDAVRAWKKLTPAERKEAEKTNHRANPLQIFWRDPVDGSDGRLENPRDYHVPCTPDSVYYDDVMKQIAKATKDHNRVAVVLQGLIDRSPAFLPHPPWKLWTPDGYAAAIELVYDNSRALAPGVKHDFDEYRKRLSESIVVGSITIGQESLWSAVEAERENKSRDAREARRMYSGRGRSYEYAHYFPSGNDGPGFLAKVVQVRGDKITFEWQRERERRKYTRRTSIFHGRDPYRDPQDDSLIAERFTCKREELFNVSAYTPGDYHLFYDDPRTRADYLKWAPFLLGSEDFHAGKREVGKREGGNVTSR